MIDANTGQSLGWWVRVFAQRMRDCGYDIHDDAVDYARWPRSKRRGPEFKALVAKLKKKGYVPQ